MKFGDINKFLNNNKPTISLLSETFGLAKDFVEKPTLLGLGQFVFGAIKSYNDQYLGRKPFTNWVTIRKEPLTVIFADVLEQNKEKVFEELSNDSNAKAYRVLVEGINFGVVDYSEENRLPTIYVEDGKVTEAMMLLSKKITEMCPNNVVLQEKKRGYSSYFELRKDDYASSKHSDVITNKSNEIKEYLDMGISRSILLYGPPGTGKTTIAHSIVNHIGLKTLRLRIVSKFWDYMSLYDAVDIIHPEAIILEDFDRTISDSEMLEFLEFINKRSKLIIASANSLTRIDAALTRPGRFDETIEVINLHEEIVKEILTKNHLKYFSKVKTWPAAFIVELSKRLMVLDDKKRIAASIKELAERVKANVFQEEEPEEEEPEEEAISTKKKRAKKAIK
jgi:hypothetical protein